MENYRFLDKKKRKIIFGGKLEGVEEYFDYFG